MLSIESLRKIDPENTSDLTDKELGVIRDSFYELGSVMFKEWCDKKLSSKNPTGLVPIKTNRG